VNCYTICIKKRGDYVEKSMISGFHHDVDEICALLGCYTVSSGNCLPMFQDSNNKESAEHKFCTQVWMHVSQKVSTIYFFEVHAKATEHL
jgi:hypothetical protein